MAEKNKTSDTETLGQSVLKGAMALVLETVSTIKNAPVHTVGDVIFSIEEKIYEEHPDLRNSTKT